MTILILGNGYIANRCKDAWPDAVHDPSRIHSAQDALRLIETHKPDAVLNAAGVRGKPNVDWCETHQMETVFGNTALPILIAEACQKAGVYLLHIGSGCIFYGRSPHADGAWREDDFGNPLPVYSRSKWAADLALSTLPNTGIARIRMPIDSMPNPNNLIGKLASFKKVIDVRNSVTVIPDMICAFRSLMEKRGQGIFHVTNPGTITHREILALYAELVDPSHTNEWIPEDALVAEGLAVRGRSNNLLASGRLHELGIEMREVHEAVRDAMKEYASYGS